MVNTQVQVLQKIIALALEQVFFSCHYKELREQFEAVLSEYVGAEDFLAMSDRIKAIVIDLVDEAPYLSGLQSGALTQDITAIFDRIAAAAQGQDGGTSEIVESCLKKLEHNPPVPALKRFPDDVVSADVAMHFDAVRELVRQVIEDIFGPDARRAKELDIGRAIEQRIRES